jgi:pimeloyl-ACP methyl ester carboxylesterase
MIRTNSIVLFFIIIFFSGCSGKQLYSLAIEFGRFEADLTKKKVEIKENLFVSYLENSVKSDKTIILVHGFGSGKDNWLKLAKALDGEYHLIIPDLIGNAGSSKPLDINYTIANQTKLLHKFIKKVSKNKRIILVGNSMGGQISMRYAIDYDIESLVVIDSMGLKNKLSFIDKFGRKKLEDIYLDICTTDKMKYFISLGFVNPPYIPNIILEYITEQKCKVSDLDRHKYAGLFDNELNLFDNMESKLELIKTPTLIVWGKEDKVIDVQNSYIFKEKIKNSKLVVLEGVGHMAMIEDAQTVASEIKLFLNKNK